jgi:hypothetical protein
VKQEPLHFYEVVILNEPVGDTFTMSVISKTKKNAKTAALERCQLYEGEGDNGYKALIAFDSADLVRMAKDLDRQNALLRTIVGLDANH